MNELSHKYKDFKLEGFNNVLKINTEGEGYLIRSKKYTFGYKDKYGYLYLTLKKNGKRKNIKLHRAVALTFIPNPDNKPCVNHINGIKTDNRVSNLEWCTHSQNMKHAAKSGLIRNCFFRGENHNTSKHTNKDIVKIRSLYSTGKFTMRYLAKEFNTSSGYISDVVNLKIRN